MKWSDIHGKLQQEKEITPFTAMVASDRKNQVQNAIPLA
jgi:hypothetical protein